MPRKWTGHAQPRTVVLDSVERILASSDSNFMFADLDISGPDRNIMLMSGLLSGGLEYDVAQLAVQKDAVKLKVKQEAETRHDKNCWSLSSI